MFLKRWTLSYHVAGNVITKIICIQIQFHEKKTSLVNGNNVLRATPKYDVTVQDVELKTGQVPSWLLWDSLSHHGVQYFSDTFVASSFLMKSPSPTVSNRTVIRLNALRFHSSAVRYSHRLTDLIGLPIISLTRRNLKQYPNPEQFFSGTDKKWQIDWWMLPSMSVNPITSAIMLPTNKKEN